MDKLQELTQKLYNEGLAKGKQEGEQILAQANAQADEIVKKAQQEAAAILEEARKDADSYRTKVEGDVKMASAQALQSVKASIENLIVASATQSPVKEALGSEEFTKEIICAVAKNFAADKQQELSLILPEKLQAKLEPFVESELSKAVGQGIQASFSKKIGAGFKIGPKDGSYFISFTDESFQELIGEYMRPATKKILFG